MGLFARNSREWMASIACLVLLVIGLALANADIRRDLFSVRRAVQAREVAALTAEGGAIAGEASGWVRALLVSQAPLVIFGLASLVLVLLLLRL